MAVEDGVNTRQFRRVTLDRFEQLHYRSITGSDATVSLALNARLHTLKFY